MIDSKQYQVNTAAIVSEDFGDEIIIVNMTLGRYYSLRGSGAMLWQTLTTSPLSITTLVNCLTTNYLVNASEAERTLNAFIDQLLAESLIVPGISVASESTVPVLEVKRPFAAPLLEIYTDMQDLLALDPIHDVNADTGWPTKK